MLINPFLNKQCIAYIDTFPIFVFIAFIFHIILRITLGRI